MLKLGALIVLLTVLLTAMAARADGTKEPRDVCDIKGSPLGAYARCWGEEGYKKDKVLRSIIRRILVSKWDDDADGRRAFIKAQQEWKVFREGQCAYKSSTPERYAAIAIYGRCISDLTVERIRHLRDDPHFEPGR